MVPLKVGDHHFPISVQVMEKDTIEFLFGE